MIEKNKLFELINPSHSENDSTEVKYNIDYLKVKMFTKLIEESDYLKDSLKRVLVENNDESDYLAEYLIFNRAVEYIETINIDNLIKFPEFIDGFIVPFIKSLHKAINYFEGNEQYEICAFLFNIEKILKTIK